MITKNCLECGAEFKVKPYSIKKGYGKYCSQKCFGLNRKGVRISPETEFKKGYKRPKWVEKKAIKAITGKNNKHWKGDDASYMAFHHWLRTHFGKANKCENPDCIYPRKNFHGNLMNKPKCFDWALKKGFNHSHKRKNYFMLCRSCHQKYDRGSLFIKLSNS